MLTLHMLGVFISLSAAFEVLLGTAQVQKTDLNDLEQGGCGRLAQKLHQTHIEAPIPPDLTGQWTSQRCEVRPGPEFILRKYRFFNQSRYEVHQYYYADADCTEPIYSIVARGTYKHRLESWIIPGGTEHDYLVSHVTAMPYDEMIASILQTRVNRTCPGFVTSQWMPYERYDLLNYVEFNDDHDKLDGYVLIDTDCTSALDFSLHELQLIRSERMRSRNRELRSLYLGDIHTANSKRQEYRPTAYQEPLLISETDGCGVCRLVANSNDFYPPRLHQRHVMPLCLGGEWLSVRCELRPNSHFLTRHLVFSETSQSWEGFYDYYSDPLCQQPMFSIYSKGVYIQGGKSPLIAGAHEADFKVMQLKVTALDMRIVKTLNDRTLSAACGKGGMWRVGMEQDVTSTQGCAQLGLKIPHVEYELVKVEKEHHKVLLYLGQRPTTGITTNDRSLRPTSFQSPLMKCSDLPEVSVSYREHSARAYRAPPPNSSATRTPTHLKLLFALVLYYVISAIH